MTVIERKTALGRDGVEYAVRPLRDRERIRGILGRRRAYAAYALGQLDPALFRETEWWEARAAAHGDAGDALVLHSRGGLGNAAFMLGEAGALDALLALHPGPRHMFLTCEVHHLDTVTAHYLLEHRQTMIRMMVTPDTFTPCELQVRRLEAPDARAINTLYRTDGAPAFYTPRQISEAVYYGAERDGRLVAVAGTHVISSASGIAVVGNVYTHPAYRGRHLAQATTSAVTEQLLRVCPEVVLSVDPTNESAVRAYERLGYREVARLIEGAAARRDLTGAVSAARRLAARLRGRNEGAEIVLRRRRAASADPEKGHEE